MSISDVFYRIWRQLSDDVKNNLISQFDRPVTYIPDEWNENKYKLDGFRNGSMSMREYLNVLVSIVK